MGRAPCCDKMGLKKGPWTPEEDQILVDFITKNGHGNWRALPKQAGLLRCGKSCRLRWTNYLRPDIKRGSFSPEEEETVIKLHQLLGNRWSTIASRLPGRTDNEIKNVWNTHLKKRLIRMGIDPVTHAVASHSASPKTTEHSLNSFHNSNVSCVSPSTNYIVTDTENLAKSSSTISSLSDSFYDSSNLSNELFSSIDSETVSADSSSSLDMLQYNCMNSFEVGALSHDHDQNQHELAIEDQMKHEDLLIDEALFWGDHNFNGDERQNQDAAEISSSEVKGNQIGSNLEPDYSMPLYPEDDLFTNMMDVPQQGWNMDLLQIEDGIDYWLQCCPLPALYQFTPLSQA